MSRNVSRCLSKSVKHGIGRLTASADAASNMLLPVMTRLTQVSHKAPMRLIPVLKSSIRDAGAAVTAISNYGAGMLQGDSAEITVNVEAGAKLGLVTQGAARIYTQRVKSTCESRLHATVEKNAMLVFAPDPCTLFASSSYSQNQEFIIDPESSVVLIDWFSSGRFENNERWEFDTLKTRTKLKWRSKNDDNNNSVPFILDSTTIDLCGSKSNEDDPHAVGDYNCFASMILYGEQIQSIKLRCRSLADTIASKHTRIRERDSKCSSPTTINNDGITNYLAGRVVMGFSKVFLGEKPSNAYVVRFAGKTNSDLYRVLHYCLQPISPSFGVEFYKDRILAESSEIRNEESRVHVDKIPNPSSRKKVMVDFADCKSKVLYSVARKKESMSSFWAVVMLADSGLPTGSFAHSAGLEAAAQLGMIKDKNDLQNYIQAAIRSSIQLVAPFLISSLQIAKLGKSRCDDTDAKKSWTRLNLECNAAMATNEPACSASIDQGKSLARVASQWLKEKASESVILDCLKEESAPHIATTLGFLGGLLNLDEIQICRLFTYCVARDIVSSAVRLSLVGPLASVSLLHNVQESAEDCIQAAHAAALTHPPLEVAAASAPVIEAIHPCHEILQVRLFRS